MNRTGDVHNPATRRRWGNYAEDFFESEYLKPSGLQYERHAFDPNATEHKLDFGVRCTGSAVSRWGDTFWFEVKSWFPPRRPSITAASFYMTRACRAAMFVFVPIEEVCGSMQVIADPKQAWASDLKFQAPFMGAETVTVTDPNGAPVEWIVSNRGNYRYVDNTDRLQDFNFKSIASTLQGLP